MKTATVPSLTELRRRVLDGRHDYAILLAGGLAMSRKTIRLGSRAGVGRVWVVDNHIDDSHQKLTDAQLSTDSHIGAALRFGTLIEIDPPHEVEVKGRGMVRVQTLVDESRAAIVAAKAAEPVDPLRFTLSAAPGALRIDDTHGNPGEWEPADPELVLEKCEIGPHTVAQIDLAAAGMDAIGTGVGGAATSVELTIEDIDGLMATLQSLRDDAIANRGFALRADGYWSNGEE